MIFILRKRRLNLLLLIFVSASVCMKPVFAFSEKQVAILFRSNLIFVEGLLSAFMVPRIYLSHRMRSKVVFRLHNDEALFHYDRARSALHPFRKAILFLESFRLYIVQSIYLRLYRPPILFISTSEYLRFSRSARDFILPYLPLSADDASRSPRLPVIAVVSNFSLEENSQSLLNFLSQYNKILAYHGISVFIAGRDTSQFSSLSAIDNIHVFEDVSAEEERYLYSRSMFLLVSSSNRAGYKTRISTALSVGLYPILYGEGSLVNIVDAPLSIPSFLLPALLDNDFLSSISSGTVAKSYDKYRKTFSSVYRHLLENSRH